MKVSKEFQVGLFMVIAITVLYLGFNYLRGIEFFDNSSKYYAKYDNVGGLTVSNAVTISGYSVGRVSDVSIVQSDSNRVIVELTIEDDILLGRGARAILDIGLLGETAITINPGDIKYPITPGDTLKSELGTGITEVITENVGDISSNLQLTIVRINTILDKFTGSSDQINNMLDNLESTTLSAKMISKDLRGQIQEMSTGYSSVIKNINSKLDELSPLISKYGSVADSLKKVDIQSTLYAAQKTLEDMDALILKIDRSEGTLNAIIEDRSLYDNLNQTVLRLDSMLNHMDKRPKDFFKPLGRDKPKGIQ